MAYKFAITLQYKLFKKKKKSGKRLQSEKFDFGQDWFHCSCETCENCFETSYRVTAY